MELNPTRPRAAGAAKGATKTPTTAKAAAASSIRRNMPRRMLQGQQSMYVEREGERGMAMDILKSEEEW
jgi:hypothetical protein